MNCKVDSLVKSPSLQQTLSQRHTQMSLIPVSLLTLAPLGTVKAYEQPCGRTVDWARAFVKSPRCAVVKRVTVASRRSTEH